MHLNLSNSPFNPSAENPKKTSDRELAVLPCVLLGDTTPKRTPHPERHILEIDCAVCNTVSTVVSMCVRALQGVLGTNAAELAAPHAHDGLFWRRPQLRRRPPYASGASLAQCVGPRQFLRPSVMSARRHVRSAAVPVLREVSSCSSRAPGRRGPGIVRHAQGTVGRGRRCCMPKRSDRRAGAVCLRSAARFRRQLGAARGLSWPT